MVVVELRNVRNYALRGVSLRVRDGELLAVLGPNGAGKTTLLNVVAGLVEYEGSVLFNGVPVDGYPPSSRGVGYVPQTLALFPHMTVYDNVAYGPRSRGLPKRCVEVGVKEVMELLGIWGLRDRYPRFLSGGERQRVALARALAVNPKILLLDEPFNSLQAGLRRSLRVEVRRLCMGLGITTFFVTHDIDEAAEVGDRVAVLKDGALISIGSFSEVLAAISRSLYRLNILKCRVLGEVGYGVSRALCRGLELLIPCDERVDGEVTVTIPPDKVLVYGARPRVGANTFKGVVKHLKPCELGAEVGVDVHGVEVVSVLPAEALRALKLGVGSGVFVKLPIRYLQVVQ